MEGHSQHYKSMMEFDAAVHGVKLQKKNNAKNQFTDAREVSEIAEELRLIMDEESVNRVSK